VKYSPRLSPRQTHALLDYLLKISRSYSFPLRYKNQRSVQPDGTESRLPREECLSIFYEIETILQERAVLESDPLTLPDDFKQLCAFTNKLTGPALPSTNSCIPDAFDGLHNPLMGLRYPDEHGEKANIFSLEDLDYTSGSMLCMGGIEAAIGGGCWLCWCKEREGGLELEMGTSCRLRRAAGDS